MIKIHLSEQELEKLAQEHWEALETYIDGKNRKSHLEKWLEGLSPVAKFLYDNREYIIKAPVDELEDWARVEEYLINKDKEFLDKIFNYSTGIKKTNPHQVITEKLGLKTCPYCNVNFIMVVEIDEAIPRPANATRKMRPDYEHFYSKSKYPFLALSFYNLVPSCRNCNSLKSNEEANANTHVHPYAQGFGDDGVFSYTPKNTGQDVEKVIVKTAHSYNANKVLKIRNNIDLFHLEERYTYHKEVVEDILLKKQINTDTYIKTLQTSYPDLNLSAEDAYRLTFGTHYAPEDFHKRPLSKLTRDIAEELGILHFVSPKE